MAVALLEEQIKALGPYDLALMANIAVVLEDAAVHCRLLISISQAAAEAGGSQALMDAGARDLIATMVTHLASATEVYNTVRDGLVADHRSKIEIVGIHHDDTEIDYVHIKDKKFVRMIKS